jgi:hypothetical protein
MAQRVWDSGEPGALEVRIPSLTSLCSESCEARLACRPYSACSSMLACHIDYCKRRKKRYASHERQDRGEVQSVRGRAPPVS